MTNGKFYYEEFKDGFWIKPGNIYHNCYHFYHFEFYTNLKNSFYFYSFLESEYDRIRTENEERIHRAAAEAAAEVERIHRVIAAEGTAEPAHLPEEGR